MSLCKAVKSRGGDVASHDGSAGLYSGLVSIVSSPENGLRVGLSRAVKSPACSADLGRSISRPAARFTSSDVEGRKPVFSSADGSNGEEFGDFEADFRLMVRSSSRGILPNCRRYQMRMFTVL